MNLADFAVTKLPIFLLGSLDSEIERTSLYVIPPVKRNSNSDSALPLTNADAGREVRSKAVQPISLTPYGCCFLSRAKVKEAVRT
jgi:hypothetical protein